MTPAREVRAARLVEHERPLEIDEVELAIPADGEVVVEMAYGGVNPVDRYVVQGRVAPDGPLPRTPGVEGVGRVEGRLVALHGAGLGTTRDGTWASAAVVASEALVDVPEGVDPAAAAAMGVAGCTAWRTVTEWAEVRPDDRVLVLGASGGVGSMIVSLVQSVGATVWGQTGHASKTPLVEESGAGKAVVVDDAGRLAEALGGVGGLRPTVVFDPLGDGFTGAAVEVLEPRGRLVVFGTSAGAEGRVPIQALYRKGLRVLGYGGLSEPPDALRRGIESALHALADGRLRVRVDLRAPLEEVNEALGRLERREVSGKIVLELGS